MADINSPIYNAILTVTNRLSVPLTDGEIKLDSGTLEGSIPTTIEPGSSTRSILITRENNRSEGVITYTAEINGEKQTFKLFFLKSPDETVATATPKSVTVDVGINPQRPLYVTYTVKLD